MTPQLARLVWIVCWDPVNAVEAKFDADGVVENDSEPGETLIIPVMRDGKRIAAAPTLEQIREHATRELARLPEMLRRLEKSDDYPVLVSDKLKALASQMDQKIRR